jgi:hypothetical protein
MGMSSDYELAVKHGSTLIRVGSSIFGGRWGECWVMSYEFWVMSYE